MANKLTKREKALLYTLLCTAIIVGGLSLLLLPAIARNTQLQEEVSAAAMQQMEMQIKSDRVEEYLATVSKLEKEAATLRDSLFSDLDPIEDLDIFITGLALKAKVSPQQLVIEAPDFRPAIPYMGDGAPEKPADDTGKVQYAGSLVQNITIGGSCSYDQFVAMLDLYDDCPRLLVGSAEFIYAEADVPYSVDTFRIVLSAYTLAAPGTPPPYLEA